MKVKHWFCSGVTVRLNALLAANKVKTISADCQTHYPVFHTKLLEVFFFQIVAEGNAIKIRLTADRSSIIYFFS